MEGDGHHASSPNNDDEIPASDLVQRQSSRHIREIQRLRNTVSFRLGKHLTDAVRQPWKFPFLPITFPIKAFMLGLEKIGKRPGNNILNSDKLDMLPPRNCILLFPTNGVGFGHFTRLYAIAKELRSIDPDTEIIFFTPMPTLHVPYIDDFPTYHVAGKYKFKDMPTSVWNGLIEEHLLMIMETHRPRMFIFDGAYPYRGMLNAIQRNDQMKRVWLRRGMFKAGSSIPVDSIACFDQIVHPGDAVESTDEPAAEHGVEMLNIPPIVLVKPDEMMEREVARNRLGLPLDAVVWYVQLGAGQINDIESEINLTLDAILDQGDHHVVVLGESLLGKRLDVQRRRVRILRDYPNGLYFKAFDYAVQAGGYNSFHEMRAIQMPTLFYPNLETGMDDQLARCQVAEKEGWGLVVKNRTEKTIHIGIQHISAFMRTHEEKIHANSHLDWLRNI